MRISKQKNAEGKILSYTMWLSVDDTYSWSATWPDSKLKDHKIKIQVESDGAYEITVSRQNGKMVQEYNDSELRALVRDHLPYDCRHLWPMWKE